MEIAKRNIRLEEQSKSYGFDKGRASFSFYRVITNARAVGFGYISSSLIVSIGGSDFEKGTEGQSA